MSSLLSRADLSLCYCTVATNCCYVVCQRWSSSPNSHLTNGRLNSAASTVQSCQTACVGNPQCNGFDWIGHNPASQRCWLSGPWSGGPSFYYGITHYFFNRSCQGKLQQFYISCIHLWSSQFVHMLLSYVLTILVLHLESLVMSLTWTEVIITRLTFFTRPDV